MTAGNGAYSGTAQNLGNDISAAVEFIRTQMDEIIEQEAKTASMVPNPAFVKATQNAGTVKVATLETTGLGTYDKVLGYPRGGAKLTWADHQLQCDRAIGITIDRADNLQTGGLVSAAAVMAEEMRRHVVPEIDATRFAKFYAALYAQNSANDNVKAIAKPTKANIVTTLTEAMDQVSNVTGTEEGMILYINGDLKGVLDTSTEITAMKDVNNPSSDVVKKIRTFNGARCEFVPANRMNTTITLNDGYTNALGTAGDLDSQDPTKYGYTPGSTPIWFAITTPGVANGVTAINAPKIIASEVNQQYDGDTFLYRIFHDLIVPKNKTPAAYMAIKSGGA